MSTLSQTDMTAMTTQRVINAYLTEAKYAFLRFLRTPAFMIPTLLFPLFFYFLVGYVFGAFRAQNAFIDVPTYMFCGFATMCAITPGMFGFGVGFAMEREQGLLTLKRALPMPPLASLFGSVMMSVLSTCIAATLLAVAASLGGFISLSLSSLAAVVATVSIGAIPFCSLGLLLGSMSTGRAAPAIVNILYILLLYFSGLFITLPASIAWVAKISPAFYLHQLALFVAGARNSMVHGLWTHFAILLGMTIVCLGIAARRLARQG